MRVLLSLLILFTAMSLVCEENLSLIQIHRIYGANPVNEKIEIYRGSVTRGTIIHTEVGRNSAFLENVIELCIYPEEHTFVLSDVSSSGWNAGSLFYVVMDGIELLRSRLEDASTAEVPFNPVYMIKTSEAWRYSSQAQSTPDWRYNVNPTWQLLNPGSFPAISTTTRYYSLSITVPPLSLLCIRVRE